MKRSISAVLLSAIMLSLFSCSSGVNDAGDSADDKNTSAVDNVVIEEEETEPENLDHLPEDLDFNGVDCVMLSNELIAADVFSEELTGESVKDSLFERTNKIEDRLGVNFVFLTLPHVSGDWVTALSGSVQAADGAYDVVSPEYWWGFETKGYYIDINTLPYFDLSQPYWCAGWNDNNEINGKRYSCVGYYQLDLVLDDEAIFFNKDLITNYNLEDPYDLVKEDRWNNDKLVEMSDSVLTDLNGDGKYEKNSDLFGLTCALHSGRGFLWSYGMKLANKTAEGWNMDYFNERFVKTYDTVYKLIKETPSVYYDTANDWTPIYELCYVFSNNLTLFYAGHIGCAREAAMREMESDFGVVPYPKLDEEQEKFITFNLGVVYTSILKSAKDPAMSAAVLEALNAENYKSVLPVLYEEAMKGKYSRDKTTAEMLDLITSNVYFDFSFVNYVELGGLGDTYFNEILGGSADVSSSYKKKQKVTEKQLEKYLEFYDD